jgi:hypothetical protein
VVAVDRTARGRAGSVSVVVVRQAGGFAPRHSRVPMAPRLRACQKRGFERSAKKQIRKTITGHGPMIGLRKPVVTGRANPALIQNHGPSQLGAETAALRLSGNPSGGRS